MIDDKKLRVYEIPSPVQPLFRDLRDLYLRDMQSLYPAQTPENRLKYATERAEQQAIMEWVSLNG